MQQLDLLKHADSLYTWDRGTRKLGLMFMSTFMTSIPCIWLAGGSVLLKKTVKSDD